jgi:hypothetical protein
LLIRGDLYAAAEVINNNEELLPTSVISEIEILSPRYRNSIYLSQRPTHIHARFTCNIDESKRKSVFFAIAMDDDKPTQWQQIQDENNIEFAINESIYKKKILTLNVYFKGIPGIDKLSSTMKVISPATDTKEIIIGDNNETLVDGELFFPSGFYSMAEGDKNEPIAKAKYNVVIGVKTSSSKAWLESCKQLGLLGMVTISRKSISNFNELAIREYVRDIKNHPALFGYYLFDEPHPENIGQTPEEMKRVYNVIAGEDPYHPVAICINHLNLIEQYIDCYDILMPDFYPIQKDMIPLNTLYVVIEKSINHVKNKKPVWPVLQAFGEDITEGMEEKGHFNTPTSEQERCMTYMALTSGIKGIMYFSYHVFTQYVPQKNNPDKYQYVLGGYLPDKQPTLWAALEKLGPEIKLAGMGIIRPDTKFGTKGSIHWALSSDSIDNDQMLIAVNIDNQNSASAEVNCSSHNDMTLLKVFGSGKADVFNKKVRLDLEPLESIAIKIKSENSNEN